MNKIKFENLKDSENLLKIDKDMVEIQKTIIFYGEKILFELDNLTCLIKQTNVNNNDHTVHPIAQQIANLKIPKGYKGN